MSHKDNLICKICMCENIGVKISNDPLEVISPSASVQAQKSDELHEEICSNCLGFEQIKIKTECEEIFIEETKISNINNSEEANVKKELQSETLPFSFIDVECRVKIECNNEDVCNEDYYIDQEESSENLKKRTKGYPCNICNKKCRNPSDLKRHQRTHTGEKPFKCEVCDREFAQLPSLKRHRPIHTPSREKAYKCDVCSNVFYTSNDLKAHQKIHTGHKPFECEICNKRFVRAHHLTLHKQIHEATRQKPYKCDVCCKDFYTSGELRKHQRTHDKKRASFILKKKIS